MTEKGLCVRHGTQSPNTAERLVYPAAPIKLYFIIARCEFNGKVAVNYISTHQEEADKITADLTLNGCMDFLRERARKNQLGNVGVATLDDLYDYFHFGGKAPTILSDEDIGDIGIHAKPIPAPEPAAPKPTAKRVNLSMDDLF